MMGAIVSSWTLVRGEFVRSVPGRICVECGQAFVPADRHRARAKAYCGLACVGRMRARAYAAAREARG